MKDDTMALTAPPSTHTIKGMSFNLDTKNNVGIPIVSHIIRDKDLDISTDPHYPMFNWDRVIKLMTDPHSMMLYQRHVSAMKKVVHHYRTGFPMKELVHVFKVLNVCADRTEEQEIYEQPMIDILGLCALPFLKEKASDEVIYEQIVVESISQLGYLMRVPCSAVRKHICLTLIGLHGRLLQESAEEKPVVEGFQSSSGTFIRKAINKCDISETFVKSLALLEHDLDVRLHVLQVLNKLSYRSEESCQQIVKVGGAYHLCCHLMDPDPSGQLLFSTIAVLWNLLESDSRQESVKHLSNITCISQLRDAFVHQLTQGYSHYDRQLRNDILVIVSMVASLDARAPFVETGFVKQLCLFATFRDVKSHNPLVKQLKLSASSEDFELCKLLYNVLVLLSQDPAAIPILSDGHLVPALLSLVRANQTETAPDDWSPAQFDELQLHALSCLCSVCPLMLSDYMACRGNTRLLLFLEWCLADDSLGGHSKRRQTRHCLRLIRSLVCLSDNELLIQDMSDLAAIHQLLGILSSAQFMVSAGGQLDSVLVEMQTDVFFTLSCLCDGDQHRKDLFGTEGVDTVLRYLTVVVDATQLLSSRQHHRLLLSVLDTVWCAVVGSYTTEDYFLEKEGVFHLLDLLEVSPNNMHNMIMGCLLDLSENPKVVTHLVTWLGRDGVTVGHLLCDAWRREEREMGVRRDANGCLLDVGLPLMGAAQSDEGTVVVSADHASPAVVDVWENKRAKIYSLFCKIGFADLKGLSVEDRVTLAVVERYLDFKVGEVWSEVMEELETEHVRPVTPDREALMTVCRSTEERGHIIKMAQYDVLEAHNKLDRQEEQKFYADIRENHRQAEKAMADLSDFVARTSNYSMLKAAKQRQRTSVGTSRIHPEYMEGENFNNIELNSLNVTVYSCKKIAVS